MPIPHSKDVLRRGQLFGLTTRSLHLREVTLTETCYAPEMRLPPHTHELPMFVFVVEGSFDESFDRYDRTCGPRSLVYRPPGERHAQRFLGSGAACLTIELPFLMDDERLPASDGRLDLAGMPALTAMRVYDELARPTTESSLIIEELTVHLAAVAARRPAIYERRPPAWLGTALDVIEGSYQDTVRLADIARYVGVHRVHLSRTFRRFLGCGLGEYVRRMRVHAACGRLRGTGTSTITLSAIAAEVGFSDESHMGRAFREIMLCPPAEYRTAAVLGHRYLAGVPDFRT